MHRIELIEKEINDLKERLRHHLLYTCLKDVEDIQVFMENHVFAVWDFMSLLKSLQVKLTTVNTPWIPPANPKLARFVNEIVYEEESDIDGNGQAKSHFEMYIEAMEQVGADTYKISKLIDEVKQGFCLEDSLRELQMDSRVVDFIHFTFSLINTDKPHLIAAAFTFGREGLIPDMFIEILKISDPDNLRYDKLRYYLQRHIELDGDEHGPLSLQMVLELCGHDGQKWREVLAVSKQALTARINLWDAIVEQIKNKRPINVDFEDVLQR
jgi:hypothetical protein